VPYLSASAVVIHYEEALYHSSVCTFIFYYYLFVQLFVFVNVISCVADFDIIFSLLCAIAAINLLTENVVVKVNRIVLRGSFDFCYIVVVLRGDKSVAQMRFTA